jgi:hypothetical protein
MDEAPGVADRELILSGMLMCSTAPARTRRKSSMKSGGSFRRKYFAGDRHGRRPIVKRRFAFAFCRAPLTELYTKSAPWKAALRLSSHSPGARLIRDRRPQFSERPQTRPDASSHPAVSSRCFPDAAVFDGPSLFSIELFEISQGRCL